MTKPKHKTVEQVIKEKTDAERLRQLENFKRNIESGVVFDLDIDKDLMEILMTYNVDQL